jgi:hypothetical protein
LGHHLLQPSNVRRLYATVVRLFPLVHCVLARTVSSSDYRGERVSISSLFSVVTNETPCDFDYLDEYEDDEGVECNDIHDDDGLTRKECGILDFFMAMIRLRSRK